MRNINEIDYLAVKLRKELGEDSASPIDIFAIAFAIENLTTVLYPMGNNISGMCIKGDKTNLIAINSDMSLGRQRFSIAHEFYHLFYDTSVHRSVSNQSFEKGDEREIEADEFASHFLLPSLALYEYISECMEITPEVIVRLEQTFGMSRKAILHRLKEENKIDTLLYNSMLTNVQSSAALLGYDTKLYKPTPISQNTRTMGQYIRIVNELYKDDKISTGKYEEYLLDAFRDDLVYGDEDEGKENID